MRIVRASEIGTYIYCHRAWWYHLQGHEPENKVELAGGTILHEKHGRTIMVSGCLQLVAYAALLLAILSATIWIVRAIM